MSYKEKKQALLVNALLKANSNKKLEWGFSDNPFETYFYTKINEKIIYISAIENKGVDSIKIEIHLDGNIIDSFIDDDLIGIDIEPEGYEYWYQAMSALLDQAKAMANGSDAVLDSLLEDLQKISD